MRGFALLLSLSTVVAQAESPDSSIKQETMEGCARAYSDPALAPLQNKMPIGLRAEATKEMRANETLPTSRERAALTSYHAAANSCARLYLADLLHDANSAQKPASPTSPGEDFVLLQKGKISYAEYFRRFDKTVQANVDDFLKNGRNATPLYESTIENWLGPFKPSYPVDSPWWNFYSYAIKTAREVDTGRLSEGDARGLIEARRLKVNDELAATGMSPAVTLNCEMRTKSGEAQDIAFVLDYANKRVGPYSATITETSVYWSSGPVDGVFIRYDLNRVSGFLNMGTDQYHSLARGRCTPAKRQF